MNKTFLTTILLSLLSTTALADPNAAQTPANGLPATGSTTPITAVQTPHPPQTINCQYRIPAETTSIEESLISTWAKKAAVQSFEFSPTKVDDELVLLKSCYTDQGWQGFNDALQKSGNVNAIKTQQLSVSSQMDGEVKFTTIKDNQWKVTVPIQVVYQNDKNKMTQLLTIDLLIGRKISGDLGIMQMIAIPRKAPGTEQPIKTAPQSPPAAPDTKSSAPAHP